MFYVEEISTDANTTRSAPKETHLRVWAGIIHRVEVYFPAGPSGLLHVQILHEGHQIYPANANQDFAADDVNIAFNDYYKLHVGLNRITIKTWNTDDTHDHICRVRLGVLPAWVVSPYEQFRKANASLKTLLRRIGAV